jgi:hypothetical protein
MRPDEEKPVWRLATPKGLPTASAFGNGSRSDAKGIIVGVHDRQP